MQEGVSLLRERLGSIEFLEERVHLFVLVGEVCLGYSRARYRRPSPGFDPAHPWFSIRIVWIGGMVESAYTIYSGQRPPRPRKSHSLYPKLTVHGLYLSM